MKTVLLIVLSFIAVQVSLGSENKLDSEQTVVEDSLPELLDESGAPSSGCRRACQEEEQVCVRDCVKFSPGATERAQCAQGCAAEKNRCYGKCHEAKWAVGNRFLELLRAGSCS